MSKFRRLMHKMVKRYKTTTKEKNTMARSRLSTRNSVGNGVKTGMVLPASYKDEDTKTDHQIAKAYKQIEDSLSILSEQMGDASEVNELMDNLDTLKQATREKQFELEMLETLAWTSKEPIIADLRNKLFMTTKLTHHQFIAEAIEHWKDYDYDECDVEECEAEPDYVTKHDFMNYIRRFMNVVSARRQRKKAVRNDIRHYMKMRGCD